MSPRLEFAIRLAYDAGRSTLAHFNVDIPVTMKQDGTPVTQADQEAERLIRRELEHKFPGEAILGEEEGETGGGDRRWVLDPIDGTKSFVCGVPLYATLLSYEEDGVPIVGVSYFPALDQMIYAQRGEGTYSNGRRCRVSKKSDLQASVLCCGSHSAMERYRLASGFLNLAKQSLATRTWGDAYGHMLVATGKVEAMVDPVVQRWDISAMQIIVEEAGGKFTGLEGNANPQTQAISSNGLLHEDVLSALRS